MTLVYSSVVFHIYPYLRGNSIPSDRNYRSAVVTIWSAVKRGRLNLDLVLVCVNVEKEEIESTNNSPFLGWVKV